MGSASQRCVGELCERAGVECKMINKKIFD